MTLKLIYWSCAIKHWFPDFKRNCNDLDYIEENAWINWEEWETYENDKRVEKYWIEEFSYLKWKNKDSVYLDPDFIYTIKLSHLSYDIQWEKHFNDCIFLKNKWCKVDKEFYNLLMKAWKRIHWKNDWVKLNVSNEDFFKENITRVYDHDFVHEQFAFYWRPLNERIREDLSSPKCSEELWDKLTHKEKIECVVEELYVLTSERFIFWKEFDKRKVFDDLSMNKRMMLKSMIIRMTSWWFNLFIKDNIREILDYKADHIHKKINEMIYL